MTASHASRPNAKPRRVAIKRDLLLLAAENYGRPGAGDPELHALCLAASEYAREVRS